MKAYYSTLYLLLCLVYIAVLSGCNGQEGKLNEPTKDSESGLHLVIETSGEFFLKREAWTNYVPTSQGSHIQRGDLVRPAEGETVTILCADLKLHTLDRESNSPCKVERHILWDMDPPRDAPKGTNGEIPYIRSPRKGKVLHRQPLLSWHDTGASSYTVAITQGTETIWQQSGVQGTELLYPDDAAPLRSGVDYLLSVTDVDSGRGSLEDPTKGLGFQVIAEEVREEVEAQRDNIRALPLSESARHLALAVYYAGKELWGEALVELEQIDPALRSPVIHRWVGDLLRAVSLSDEAESAYQSALDSATAKGDLETQAAAHAELWELRSNGEEHLQAAINLYEELGDEMMTNELREKLP